MAHDMPLVTTVLRQELREGRGSMDSTLNPGCVRQDRGNGPERVATPEGLARFEVPSVQPLELGLKGTPVSLPNRTGRLAIY